jgi:glycerol-3-phosphate dehydrogenase
LSRVVDLIVIGGGINGCGVARDAAGRGLSVVLCEMNDLASSTSSWSTKLIHGGLRYLEHYEFRLVREALTEREILWSIAPHIIRPLRFVLPHRPGLRPAWVLRVGLFLYDHIGGRKQLRGTRTLRLDAEPLGRPLRLGMFGKGFEYSDCRVDDSRLVVLNARDAADRGAGVRCRTALEGAERVADVWAVRVRDCRTGAIETLHSRALINAAGPWVEEVLSSRLAMKPKARVRLVQGSHIVVRRLYDHDRAYILQNPDGRIVFTIPFERNFTLIGTTDRDYAGDPSKVAASEEEVAYLCQAVSENFARPVTVGDVVWSYSGVRPLYDDGASEAKAATRDYVLEVDDADSAPPVVSIFGGKITTYRRLAEEVLRRLETALPRIADNKGWTARAPLPGGDFAVDGLRDLEGELGRAYPFLAATEVARLARAYGTRTHRLLGAARGWADLGKQFGESLTEAEVRYLAEQEWAETAEDVVWRRSKLGLHMTPGEVRQLDEWMRANLSVSASARARSAL